MFCSREFINYYSLIQEDEKSTQTHCLGLSETEPWVILPGDRALSIYDSFSGKMILKRLFVSDTGEASTQSLLRSQGDRTY